jgi:hypothetical protein
MEYDLESGLFNHFNDNESINAGNEPLPSQKIDTRYDNYNHEYFFEFEITEEDFKELSYEYRRLIYRIINCRRKHNKYQNAFYKSDTYKDPNAKISRIYRYLFSLNERQKLTASKFYVIIACIIASFIVNILQYFNSFYSFLFALFLITFATISSIALIVCDLIIHLRNPFHINQKFDNESVYDSVIYDIRESDKGTNIECRENVRIFTHAGEKELELRSRLFYSKRCINYVLSCWRISYLIKLNTYGATVINKLIGFYRK